jgi:WD40 repeat protein
MQILDARHTDTLRAIEFGPDDRLATASQDGSVRIWDLPTGALVSVSRPVAIGSHVTALAWDGPNLGLLGQYRSTLTIDQLGRVVAKDAPAKEALEDRGVRVDHAGRQIEWTRLPQRSFSIPEGLSTYSLTTGNGILASSDGTVLAATVGSEVLIWRDAGEPRRIRLPKPVKQLALAPRGDVVAAAYDIQWSKASAIVLIDTRSVVAPRELPGVQPHVPAGDHVLAFAPDGKRLAAAQVGAVQVWSVGDGKLVATIRPRHSLIAQTGDRDWGSYMDVAYSPSGRWLVAGGSDGHLDLFDAATLRHARVLGSDVTRPFKIVLAGDRIAAIARHAAAVWSISEGRLVDRAVVPAVHDATMIGNDLMLARYTDTAWQCRSGEHGIFLDRWKGLEVPAGYDKLLLLDDDEADDDVGDPFAPKPARKPATHGIATTPRCLSPDRGELADVTCFAQIRRQPDAIEIFDPATKRVVRLSGSPETAGLVQVSFDRRYAYAVSGSALGLGNQLHVWDRGTGKRLASLAIEVELEAPTGRSRIAGVHRYWVSGDAIVLGYGTRLGWRTLPGGAPVRDLELSAVPRALAWVSPDEQLVGLADGSLVRVRGGRIGDRVVTAGGAIESVHYDPATRLAATLSIDGSVRLFDAGPTLRERVAFATFDDGEWIAYTPAGAYRGTPEVADRVRWTFADAQSFRFEQFAGGFDDAALVTRRARGDDVDVTAPPRHPPAIAAKLLEVAGATARVEVTTRGATRVDHVRAFVEGRAVAAAAVCAVADTRVIEVPIPGGDARIALAAFDADGLVSNAAIVDARAATTPTRPDVWVVAAGVSHYTGLSTDEQLQFADDDARAVAATFGSLAGAGKPFAAAHVIPPLVDEQVSIASLEAALGKLAGMKPDDLAVVFLAGHGVKLDGDDESALLTSPATSETAIRWQTIATALDRLPGRVLVLLDACHSGHLTRERVVPNAELAGRLARRSRAGLAVLAASKGRQLSYEVGKQARGITRVKQPTPPLDGADGHGLFTDALIRKLLDPATDRGGDGIVDLDELVFAVTDHVARETEGQQTPWLARREIFGSFTVVPRR